MASLIHELENNEAVLLMYLADELPAEDRAEVEQLLRNDANLASLLEALRDTDRQVHAALDDIDAGLKPVVSESAAVRQVVRAMNKWAINRSAPPPPKALDTGRRLPGWVYPMAAAAMLLIGYVSWWGWQPDIAGPTMVGDPALPQPPSGEHVQMPPILVASEMDGLDEIERELRSLDLYWVDIQ